ncbi:PREDICTED: uncharacterized protein LOC105110128 isoform X2 [Populus euphratica]|uniref:Uncharacterized protein LOC105110128 isoform X2 n=1 Tax=Populus euphratica TaxID=75702 RepID=A0AAJ6X2W1_POPEU|nr:PREDICTED: uncharacterized protein LOC105110128 isoform X2 [Populus euphratica]
MRCRNLVYSCPIVMVDDDVASSLINIAQSLDAAIEEREGFRNGVELVKSVSDKHIDLLRPSARYYTASKGQATDAADGEKGKYTLIRDPGDFQGIYDKPLPCFGCGVGWFSFLLGFVFPLMWYYGTFLYFGNYHRRDPRERAGLAAAAIAAMVFSVVLMVIAAYFSLF